MLDWARRSSASVACFALSPSLILLAAPERRPVGGPRNFCCLIGKHREQVTTKVEIIATPSLITASPVRSAADEEPCCTLHEEEAPPSFVDDMFDLLL